jgi:S1-C subfamily serine protease
MSSREILNRVKQATVALAVVPETPPADPKRTPFLILGSGFCVDPTGIIVTCEHVLSAFLQTDIRKAIGKIPEADRRKKIWPIEDLKVVRPHVLFFDTKSSSKHLFVVSAPLSEVIGSLKHDLGLLRLGRTNRFPSGYPFVEIEPFENLHEGMELATCGFPLGNELQDQAGTKTSSFTRGILSSIAPMPGVSEDLVERFQLDITTTFGNSGGPVFSWKSGKVFGVLQGGPSQRDGSTLPGIALAEPIYFLFRSGVIDRIRTISLPK